MMHKKVEFGLLLLLILCCFCCCCWCVDDENLEKLFIWFFFLLNWEKLYFWIWRNCDVLLVLWLLLVEGRRWQKRKIIRCWWFSVVYNTPAIEWLKQYKNYQTLNTNRKDHISKRRKTYETKLRHFIVRGSKWKRKNKLKDQMIY